MTFKPNQTLNLPELAAHVGSASAEFRVVDTLAGGMTAALVDVVLSKANEIVFPS
jgi:hypothetical protein